LHTTGAGGPLIDTTCTSDATVLVDLAAALDVGAAADVDVSGLARWLAEHAPSPTIATVADNQASRVGRMARS